MPQDTRGGQKTTCYFVFAGFLKLLYLENVLPTKGQLQTRATSATMPCFSQVTDGWVPGK